MHADWSVMQLNIWEFRSRWVNSKFVKDNQWWWDQLASIRKSLQRCLIQSYRAAVTALWADGRRVRVPTSKDASNVSPFTLDFSLIGHAICIKIGLDGHNNTLQTLVLRLRCRSKQFHGYLLFTWLVCHHVRSCPLFRAQMWQARMGNTH